MPVQLQLLSPTYLLATTDPAGRRIEIRFTGEAVEHLLHWLKTHDIQTLLVEGMSKSGKSTFAEFLYRVLGWRRLPTSGSQELLEETVRLLNVLGVVESSHVLCDGLLSPLLLDDKLWNNNSPMWCEPVRMALQNAKAGVLWLTTTARVLENRGLYYSTADAELYTNLVRETEFRVGRLLGHTNRLCVWEPERS